MEEGKKYKIIPKDKAQSVKKKTTQQVVKLLTFLRITRKSIESHPQTSKTTADTLVDKDKAVTQCSSSDIIANRLPSNSWQEIIIIKETLFLLLII